MLEALLSPHATADEALFSPTFFLLLVSGYVSILSEKKEFCEAIKS